VRDSLGSTRYLAYLRSLRNVLVAYAMRNKEVGYCQSMNFIAALLLLHMSEERAFWVLAVMIEDIAPTNHLSSLLGVRVDQLVFRTLVASTLPELNAHFKATDTILVSRRNTVINLRACPLPSYHFLSTLLSTRDFSSPLP
jgi:hypothetical protein